MTMLLRNLRIYLRLLRIFDQRHYGRQVKMRWIGKVLGSLHYLYKVRKGVEVSVNSWFLPNVYRELNPDVAKVPGSALLHYLRYGENEGRLYSKVVLDQSEKAAREVIEPSFDAGYYQRQAYSVIREGYAPLDHYLKIGSRVGLDPSPLFSVGRYLLEYPDVREAGVDPYSHFLVTGSKEGRAAHLVGVSVKISEKRLAEILRFFDCKYYVQQNNRLAGLTPPELATHYLRIGRFIGAEPAPWFSSAYYSREAGVPIEDGWLRFSRVGAKSTWLPRDPSILDDFVVAATAEELSFESYGAKLGIKSRTEAAKHYLLLGQYLGLEPIPGFEPSRYLEANPDVAEAGVEPFYHYCVRGRTEGRSMSVPAQSTSVGIEIPMRSTPAAAAVPEGAIEMCREAFNPEFYLAKYSDVAEAGIDPFKHWWETGQFEGRCPSRDFDPEFYSSSNPDVKDSGLPGYYHFLIAGRAEGRLGVHPGGSQYSNFILTCRMLKKPVDNGLKLVAEQDLELSSLPTARLVVAFGHDDYTVHTGGIQTCIRREAREANGRGISYLYVFPAFASMAVQSGDVSLRVLLDGTPIGSTHSSSFQSWLMLSSVRKVIVHSILGHSRELLDRLGDVPAPSRVFWLHDFSLLCPSVNLLRNTFEFCGNPPEGSSSCHYCVFGMPRYQLRSWLKDSALLTSFIFVAPSKSTAEIYREDALFARAEIVVRPHIELRPTSDVVGRGGNVAYFGFPVGHKGFQLMKNMAAGAMANRVKFYTVGGRPSDVAPELSPVFYSNSSDSQETLAQLIKRLEISVAFVPSIWPETFCLIAAELIELGLTLVTINGSGNVEALARRHGGFVVSSAELINCPERVVAEALGAPRRRHNAIWSDLSFSVGEGV